MAGRHRVEHVGEAHAAAFVLGEPRAAERRGGAASLDTWDGWAVLAGRCHAVMEIGRRHYVIEQMVIELSKFRWEAEPLDGANLNEQVLTC